MAFKLKKIASITYPSTMAETMVIGSDNASLRKAYRYFIDEKLGIKEYFFNRNKGLIDSLAFNPNRDRPHSIDLINKNLSKGVSRILIVTHVDFSDCRDKLAQNSKRTQKVENAIAAARTIHTYLSGPHSKLKSVKTYIISINGDIKDFHEISVQSATNALAAR